MQKTRKHCCLNADIHVIYSYIETELQPFRGGRPLILDNAQRWIQPPSQIQRRAGSSPHADPALRWIQTQGRSSTVLDPAPMQIQRGAGSSTVLDPALRWIQRIQHRAGSSTALAPALCWIHIQHIVGSWHQHLHSSMPDWSQRIYFYKSHWLIHYYLFFYMIFDLISHEFIVTFM